MLQRERESSRKKRVLRFDEEIEQQQQQGDADHAQKSEQQADKTKDKKPAVRLAHRAPVCLRLRADAPLVGQEQEAEAEATEEDLDIRELDFMLTHDLDKLSKDSTRELSLHDINLLKVIVASGTVFFSSCLVVYRRAVSSRSRGPRRAISEHRGRRRAQLSATRHRASISHQVSAATAAGADVYAAGCDDDDADTVEATCLAPLKVEGVCDPAPDERVW
jgi:hypothetical protein